MLESRFNQKATMRLFFFFFYYCLSFFCSTIWETSVWSCDMFTDCIQMVYPSRWRINTGSDYSFHSLWFQLFVQVLTAQSGPWLRLMMLLIFTCVFFFFFNQTDAPSPHFFLHCLKWLCQFLPPNSFTNIPLDPKKILFFYLWGLKGIKGQGFQKESYVG